MPPRRPADWPQLIAVSLLLTASAIAGCDREIAAPPAPAALNPQALQAWEQISTVLLHPRCLNCHQVESPLQGDSAGAHIPLVVRGPDGLGADAMRCTNCHNQQGNNETAGVPGAPHWSLAPLSMSWAGLSSAQLCRALTDPKRNGGRSAQELLEHMDKDQLVLWGWSPGAGRQPAPIPHAQFIQLVKTWIDADMPCPGQENE